MRIDITYVMSSLFDKIQALRDLQLRWKMKPDQNDQYFVNQRRGMSPMTWSPVYSRPYLAYAW